MDFQSAMETFAEAWVAANTKTPDAGTQREALALTRNKSPVGNAPSGTGRSSRESAERENTPMPPQSVTPHETTVSPTSIKEEFEGAKSTAKSLPVHCVVEAIWSLDEHKHQHLHQASWRRRPPVEIDSYVIIPSGTPFHNLVQAAMVRLGYSPETAAAARGALLIKNWKALAFDQISEDPLVTVGDILGDLSTVATLRIQVFRSRPTAAGDIKDKLLRYLLSQSHGLLLSSGCPLDEISLSQICRSGPGINGPVPELPEEVRRKFDQWWSTQFSPQSPSRAHINSQISAQYPPTSQPTKMERPVTEPVHPAMQTVHHQFPTQKTRMRTSFDPELELPKLQKWFSENQHPSRQQIQQYVRELNSLESRRGRKPLDVNNVVYWFKNARAAQKRQEIRNVGPGLSCSIGMNGYNNHSPTNGAGFLLNESYLNAERMADQRMKNSLALRRGQQMSHLSDEFSNPGSDMDEDDANECQPPSPVAPLSLTAADRKNESDSPKPLSPKQNNEMHTDQPNEREVKEERVEVHSPEDRSNIKQNMSEGEEEDEGESEVKPYESMAEVPQMIRPLAHRAFCGSPDVDPQYQHRPPSEGLERLAASFPMVPNAMFNQSIMYMSQYLPGLNHTTTSPPSSSALGLSALTAEDRRKRNRTFIDPVTEVPRLEQWFNCNTHPSHNLILKYTEELNMMAYRQKFPRLEPKNVQFWFKNRRAKCKRLKMSLFDSQSAHYHHGDKE